MTIEIKDIANQARQAGYDHVHYSGPKGGPIPKKPFQAIACDGTNPKMDKAGRRWRGPRRATAEESAQDYCDYRNSGGIINRFKLNTAGHVRVKLESVVSPKRAAARRLMAEAVSEEKSTNGFVYCISDGTALKIGKTVNHPTNRVADLQTGNPRLLKLLAYVEAEDVAVAEAEMHARFAHLSVLGEWFEHDVLILTEFGVTDVTLQSDRDTYRVNLELT